MADYLDRLLETAAGFPNCRRCMYLETGSAALCSRCAGRTLEPLAPDEARCGTCAQPYQPNEDQCRNPLCNAGWRMFDWNYAIAMRTAPLKNAIAMYKYGGEKRWATIFGRIVAGFIEDHAGLMSEFDIITATPTYLGPGGRTFDHTRDVLAVADLETGGRWPFDVEDSPVIVQMTATERMARIKTYAARKEHARTTLRAALSIPDPARTKGMSILVYDDLFTNGLVLNEVARALIEDGGADRICGISLAREPWTR